MVATNNVVSIFSELEQSVLQKHNKKKVAQLAEALQREAIATGSPFTEEDTALFLFFGDVKRVEVVGGFSFDRAEVVIPLQRLANLNLWAGRAKILRDSEFFYQLRVDGSLRTDPLCKESFSEEFILYSVGRMPNAQPLKERIFHREIDHGILETFEIFSDYLKNPRRIHVYLPPGYGKSRKKYPVLYVQDGDGTIQFGKYDRIMDNLLAEGKIEPLILCFIPPENRVFDYWFSDYEYAQFVCREVIQCIDSRYRTKADRENRAITGATFGGRIAAYIATNYSELFGICIGQSVYLENNSKITERLKKKEYLPIRFFFSVGLFQKTSGRVLGKEFERDLVAVNREINELLKQNGNWFIYRELPSNNCMLTWSRGIVEALQTFWPEKSRK